MATDARLTAVALAGGELEADFRQAGYEVPNKAYLPIAGVTMLERVLRGLRASSSVARIRCVTPPAAMTGALGDSVRSLCDDVVAPGRDLIDSVQCGFARLAPEETALVVATDIPLVTPDAIDDFVAHLRGAPCDVGYGFVSRASHELRYPQIRHTWVRLREGTYCGSGISAIRAGAIGQLSDLLRRFVAARKSPLKLARLFSVLLALRMLFGGVPIAELEKRAGALSGLRCRGIACDQPELAVNVDCLADLRAVEALLRSQT